MNGENGSARSARALWEIGLRETGQPLATAHTVDELIPLELETTRDVIAVRAKLKNESCSRIRSG